MTNHPVMLLGHDGLGDGERPAEPCGSGSWNLFNVTVILARAHLVTVIFTF